MYNLLFLLLKRKAIFDFDLQLECFIDLIYMIFFLNENVECKPLDSKSLKHYLYQVKLAFSYSAQQQSENYLDFHPLISKINMLHGLRDLSRCQIGRVVYVGHALEISCHPRETISLATRRIKLVTLRTETYVSTIVFILRCSNKVTMITLWDRGSGSSK